MKYICFLLLLFFTSVAAQAFQTKNSFELPKAEDVEKIETRENKYNYRYHTPESLLRILPHLVAGNIKVTTLPEFQYGTITLKNGTVLKWRSSRDNNLTIYSDKLEQSYVLDESYIINSRLTPLWMKFFSAFVFIIGITGIVSFYDHRQKYPDSHLTHFYTLINSSKFANILIRIIAASLIFYLGYLLLSEPLQAINDGVIRGMLSKGRGHYVFFADSDPGNFKFFVFSEALPAIFAFFCGLCILLGRPEIKYWHEKLKNRLKMPANKNLISKSNENK